MKVCTGAKRYRCVSVVLAAALLFLIAIPAFSQLPTGTILGVVKDASGAVVPGATVSIQSSETDLVRKATTDSSGAYRVPALPVGHYDVKVEQTGFKTETQVALNLEVGQEAVLDFSLQIGASEQTVQVTGEAQQVNTTNSTLGSVVSEQTIADLPLNGRNYTDLTLLQPGITQHKNLTNSGGNQPGTVFSSNGAPIQSNNYMLDGASLINTYAVSAASGTGNTLGVDGIREYKVVTNNFSAEYGMTMGSQTVLVSKSGTNDFHGDAFEFLRNQALDAENFFDTPQSAGLTASGQQRRIAPFRRNNFGGALGGPVRKDKTFFFGAYEGLRESIGQTINTSTVPDACFVATKNPCATKAPVGTVSSSAFVVLSDFPKIGCIALPCNYSYPSTEPINENWGQGRIDHTFSASDTVFGRYTFDDSFYKYGLSYHPFTQTQGSRGQFATIAENHVFSPALLNSFRFSFSRTATTINSLTDSLGPAYPNFFSNQQVNGFGTVIITGLTPTTLGGGFGPTSTLPNYPNQNIWTYSDDVFYVKGKHSLKFGTLINHYQQDLFNRSQSRGQITFTDLPTFLSGTFQSAQIGIYPSSSYPGLDLARRHYRNTTIGFYGQDDFKVRPNLTLNLGLRYEFQTVVSDRDGLNSSSTPTCAYPCAQVGPIYKNPSLRNFSPRVGFAWDVFGNGKTSVRGGAAELYDLETLGAILSGSLGKTPPYGLNTVLASGPFVIGQTIVTNGSVSAETVPVSGVAYNQKAPRMYQWNLTVERQLPWTMALEVSYVGSRGIHLIQSADTNPRPFTLVNGQPFWPAFVNPAPGAAGTRVVNPTQGAFSTGSATGDSIYHGLEVGVTKRASHGLQFQSEYTYSKLIDDQEGDVPSQSSSTAIQPISILLPRLDRGLAPFDARQNYRFNTIYNLPTFNPSNSIVKGLVNGWWTAIILSAQTGTPFTPSVQTNRSRSGTGSSNPSNYDRPNWAPGRNPYNATHGVSSGCTEGTGTSALVIPAGTPLGGPNLFFDPCAFALGAVGFEGNVGRDSVIGPGLLDLDYSLVKDTSVKWLGEAGKVQFRAEFFNILNHPNFAQPTRTVLPGTLTDGATCPQSGCPTSAENYSTNAGIIFSTASGTTATQSAGNSRQIQFGLKIVF